MKKTDTHPGIYRLAQQATPLIYLASCAFIMILIMRTWLVMGLITPVTVSGSSMAPTLVGPHIEMVCSKCQQTLCLAAQQLPTANLIHCPYCQQGRLDWTHAGSNPGTRLWIDRTLTGWRLPHRWEVVVFYSPWQNYTFHSSKQGSHETAALCTKRVLGLPGEQLQLVAGDLWIDGQLQVKKLNEQRLLRQLIRCKPSPLTLPKDNKDSEKESLFLTDQSYTDDAPYNGQLSRKLNLVHDFMLSTHLTCQGKGSLTWTIDDGRQPLAIQIQPAAGTIQLLDHGRPLLMQTLSESSRQRLAHGEVLLELSTFDRQLLLAIDGQVELQYPLQLGVLPAGTRDPFVVTVTNLTVSLREAALWRDVYYGARPVGLGSWGTTVTRKNISAKHQTACWQLASDELFLVGDNAPVSIDSRVWPQAGIPRHLLVGRVIGSH